jgi:hypothetical protein
MGVVPRLTQQTRRGRAVRRQIVSLRITHRQQVQTFSRRGHPALGSITPLQHFPRPLDRPITDADSHQHTSDIAHHMM